MADTETLKKVACDAIDKAAEELNEVSQEIWKHPELYWEEKYAHQVCCIHACCHLSTTTLH
jgi:metal-dependent amidase/aminoacylase/carboxypeptidase family protein